MIEVEMKERQAKLKKARIKELFILKQIEDSILAKFL
jgi:hypothetical protein